jgi:hypothetical protein
MMTGEEKLPASMCVWWMWWSVVGRIKRGTKSDSRDLALCAENPDLNQRQNQERENQMQRSMRKDAADGST